jgi:hypothetical protein
MSEKVNFSKRTARKYFTKPVIASKEFELIFLEIFRPTDILCRFNEFNNSFFNNLFCRNFDLHREEMKKMLSHYAVNESLAAEVDRLRLENERLKSSPFVLNLEEN